MAEARVTWLRALFFALLIVNVIALAYLAFRTDPQIVARTHIEELQINPGRIRVLLTAVRGGGQTADAAKSENTAAPR